MGKFCRKCGTENEAAARFCENCGAEFPALKEGQADPNPAQAQAATRATSVPVAMPKLSKKAVLFGGLGSLAVLGIGGGVAWYVSYVPALDQTLATSALNAQFGKREAALNLVCNSNMDYSRKEVRVGGYDGSTRQWMDMLVESNFYSPPVDSSSGGFFPQPQLVYAKTEQGAQATLGNRLCVAAGIEVASIQSVSQPNKENMPPTAQVEWLAKFKDPSAAVNFDVLKEQMPNAKALALGTMKLSGDFVFRDGKWVLTTVEPKLASARNPLLSRPTERAAPNQQAVPSAKKEGSSFFDSLASLFSFSSGPSAVAKSYMEASMRGDMKGAVKYLKSEYAQLVDAGGLQDAQSTVTAQLRAAGINVSVSVESEKITGDKAVVTVKLNGLPREMALLGSELPVYLSKENGDWKVDPMGMLR